MIKLINTFIFYWKTLYARNPINNCNIILGLNFIVYVLLNIIIGYYVFTELVKFTQKIHVLTLVNIYYYKRQQMGIVLTCYFNTS